MKFTKHFPDYWIVLNAESAHNEEYASYHVSSYKVKKLESYNVSSPILTTNCQLIILDFVFQKNMCYMTSYLKKSLQNMGFLKFILFSNKWVYQAKSLLVLTESLLNTCSRSGDLHCSRMCINYQCYCWSRNLPSSLALCRVVSRCVE